VEGLQQKDVTKDYKAYSEFAEFHEQYVSKYIQLADAKAGAWFAVVSGICAYLVNGGAFVKILISPSWSWIFALAFMTAVLLLTSAAASFLIIFPREAKTAEGVVFWKSVASFVKAGDFVRRITGMSFEQISLERLTHCYDLSRICRAKYQWLRVSMLTGIGGIILVFLCKIIIGA
jgi:hypothetical protein